MSSGAPVTTFWRMAGMSYLQYVNRSATAVRNALKEPAKSKLMTQQEFSYKVAGWSEGNQGAKTEITALGKAGAP